MILGLLGGRAFNCRVDIFAVGAVKGGRGAFIMIGRERSFGDGGAGVGIEEGGSGRFGREHALDTVSGRVKREGHIAGVCTILAIFRTREVLETRVIERSEGESRDYGSGRRARHNVGPCVASGCGELRCQVSWRCGPRSRCLGTKKLE
jgi:hypothetical protein